MSFPRFYQIKPCLLRNLNFVMPHFSGPSTKECIWSLIYDGSIYDYLTFSGLKVIHSQWKLYFEFLSFPGQAVCGMMVSHDAASGIEMILPVG